jgi:hypothetical protein
MCSEKSPGTNKFIWLDGNGPLKCSVCDRVISMVEADQIENSEFEEWKKGRGL